MKNSLLCENRNSQRVRQAPASSVATLLSRAGHDLNQSWLRPLQRSECVSGRGHVTELGGGKERHGTIVLRSSPALTKLSGALLES